MSTAFLKPEKFKNIFGTKQFNFKYLVTEDCGR
jgi:hypothetical protein